MIQNQVKRDIITTEIGQTTKMGVEKSDEVEAHIVKVLTENYKYPIESHARESVSNHWDANFMVEKPNNPIFVKIYRDETNQWVFETTDEALGMDENDFDAYYMKIGASNKRNNPFVIGGKGCGAKAILSYTDSYEVITRKNGKEYKFLVFKGDILPEKLKIYEKETSEPNGVIIRVKIKRWDESNFKQACFKQLCYFPTVVFQFEGDNTDYLSKKVFENDLFKWSELYPSNELHISLGLTHYELDWKVLGISKINIPVAIKIPLDSGIDVFFNRESIIYNEFAKNYIKDKIKQISEYFVNKYNESVPEEQELLKVFKDIDNDRKIVKLADKEFVINSLLQYSSVKPKELKIKGISIETPNFYYKKRSELLDEYEIVVHLENTTWRTKHIKGRHSWMKILDGIKHIEVERVPTGLVKKYLLEKHGSRNLIFLKKISTRKLGSKYVSIDSNCYKNILNLVMYKKDTWRNRIQEWQFVENQFKSLIINEIDTENTKEYQEWLLKHKEEQKQNRAKGYSSGNYKTLNKKEGEVTISYCVPKSVGTGFKFEKTTNKIAELHKQKSLTILFTEEEKEKALNLRNLQSKWRIAIVGKNEGKKIENIHNFVTFKQFMEKSKPFKRLMTSFLFEKEVKKYDNIFNRKDLEIIQNCLKPLYNDIQLLKSYVSKNGKYVRDNELLEQMIEVAKEYNLYDYEFWTEYQNVKNSLQKYEFITLLQSPSHWNEEETTKVKSLINQILFHQQKYRGLHNELEIVVKPKESVVGEEETILETELVEQEN